MRSSRSHSGSPIRLADQRGLGLVEILVASAILGVALAVMLGNMSTMVVGARVADRRTGEERLVRNEIESLMAQTLPPPGKCPKASSKVVSIGDNPAFLTKYTVKVSPDCKTLDHYLGYKVTATDGSGALVQLTVGRYWP